MGTKENPGAFDCYANAEPDEPMFVLLARDPEAPDLVIRWMTKRIRHGLNRADDPQITEAGKCATEMKRWRDARKNREES